MGNNFGGVEMVKITNTLGDVLFTLENGDNLRITDVKGEAHEFPVKELDETHFYFGQVVYHVCQFAEMIARTGLTVTKVEKINIGIGHLIRGMQVAGFGHEEIMAMRKALCSGDFSKINFCKDVYTDQRGSVYADPQEDK
jgi:hypothetical protein